MSRRNIQLRANSGFTMIELLCVIIIIGSLSASAIPSFLDIRTEAKVAMVRQHLATLRTGISLGTTHIKIRCGAPANSFLDDGLRFNDLVNVGAMPGFQTWRVWPGGGNGTCTTAQIPNSAERKLFDGPSGYNGTSAPFTAEKFPCNPFYTPGCAQGANVWKLVGANIGYACVGTGGKCGCADITNAGFSFGTYMWIYFQGSYQVISGTNVAGECDL